MWMAVLLCLQSCPGLPRPEAQFCCYTQLRRQHPCSAYTSVVASLPHTCCYFPARRSTKQVDQLLAIGVLSSLTPLSVPPGAPPFLQAQGASSTTTSSGITTSQMTEGQMLPTLLGSSLR
jgi:hypothetical protein